MAELKNAKQYTEELDKVASVLQEDSPELALQIDKISDVVEGKKEASTLKFDADEARYMADRFNYKVRAREADEPFMDSFNKDDFSQVMRAKKSPTPIGTPYQKVQEL
jgi:hypothetical protein